MRNFIRSKFRALVSENRHCVILVMAAELKVVLH